MRALHGPAVEWGATEHLTALAVDQLARLVWQGGGGKGPRPRPIPRPDRRHARSKLTHQQMADRLRAQLDRRKEERHGR